MNRGNVIVIILWRFAGEAGRMVAVRQWQEEPHVDHRPRTDPDPQGRGGGQCWSLPTFMFLDFFLYTVE